MGQYLPIVVLTALAVVFGVLSLVASKLLAPKRPNTAKDAPYECGIVPSRESPERFPVSFYIVSLGAFGFWEMIAFSAVFFVAFVYMVARGALEWGPMVKERPVSDVTSLPRAQAGVKIVGLDGRSLPDGREAGAA
ncbi:MAG: NADH-ubiquinone/plastoquinone oxidoreductase chain 3 [Actinobacteria bacterium]|nr:NADH-ubiquinone/plastoquinone oxidoreductase chain 3 [Actinomycetota bacterium]